MPFISPGLGGLPEVGAAARLHPTTQQMPQAPAPCLNPDLVPSTSTEFTLKKYGKANCEQPPLRGLPSGGFCHLAWGWRTRRAGGAVEVGDPDLPSLPSFLRVLASLRGLCHPRTTGNGAGASPGAGPSAEQTDTGIGVRAPRFLAEMIITPTACCGRGTPGGPGLSPISA